MDVNIPEPLVARLYAEFGDVPDRTMELGKVGAYLLRVIFVEAGIIRKVRP